MDQTPEDRFSLLVPEALSRRPRQAGGPQAVEISDIREVFRDSLAEAPDVWLFEARVRQPENLMSPHRFGIENLVTTALLGAPAPRWDDLEELNSDCEPILRSIPQSADLFCDWPAVEAPVRRIFRTLMESHGRSVSTASSLLYQKRPRLIPVLDRPLRLALNSPLSGPARGDALLRAISQLKSIGDLPRNAAALARLEQYLGARPEVGRYLAFSRMRLLSLVIAGASTAVSESGEPLTEGRARGKQRRRRRKQPEDRDGASMPTAGGREAAPREAAPTDA